MSETIEPFIAAAHFSMAASEVLPRNRTITSFDTNSPPMDRSLKRDTGSAAGPRVGVKSMEMAVSVGSGVLVSEAGGVEVSVSSSCIVGVTSSNRPVVGLGGQLVPGTSNRNTFKIKIDFVIRNPLGETCFIILDSIANQAEIVGPGADLRLVNLITSEPSGTIL